MNQLVRAATRFARQPDVAAIAVFAILALAFCGRFIVGGSLLPADALYTAPPWETFAAQQGVQGVHNELIADLVLQNYSWKRFIAESYAQGQFPLWNPSLFAGMPFLAGGQSGALYPLWLIFAWLPPAMAYGPFIALHLFLAGAFSYLYLRILGVGRAGALVGGVTFELAGFLLVSFLWPMIVSAAIWLPLGLAMCELVVRHLERGTWLSKVGLTPAARLVTPIGALAIGMQLLAGHLEISFYFLFTLMVYSAFRLLVYLFRDRNLVRTFRGGLSLVTIVGIGFTIAAAQLLPFFDLIQENYRIGQSNFADALGWALPKQHVLAYLVPDIFGNPTHHTIVDWIRGGTIAVTNSQDSFGNIRDYPFWGIKNYVEGAVYVGLLPLILAAVAIVRRRDRFTAFFGGYLAWCLLLAFGTPLYTVIWRIPGANQLHTPFRWVYPASFCLAVLAALGTDWLFRRRSVAAPLPVPDPIPLPSSGVAILDRPAPARLPIATRHPATVLGSIVLAASAVVALALAVSRVVLEPTLALLDVLKARSTNLALAFPDTTLLYSYEASRLFGFGLVLAASGVAMIVAGRRPRLAGPVLAAVVAADLFITYFGFNTATDPKLAAFVPPSIAAIQQDTGLYRVTSFNLDDTLRPNSNMIFGLQDIRGYDTIIPRRYVEYWKLMEEPSGLLYSMINKLTDARSLQSPLLDLLNVKYVLTTQNIGEPGWTEIYRGEIQVYRNDRVMPRAFVAGSPQYVGSEDDARRAISAGGFDPRRTVVIQGDADSTIGTTTGSATIEQYAPNTVRIRVNASAPAYLVLLDSDFPGWRATVNDRDATISRANALFRAVRVDAGESVVVFRYVPFSFQIGGYLSALGLFAVGLGLAYALWAWVYRPEADATTVQRIFKNSLAPMMTQLANRFVDLAFAIVVARLLGPASVGEYGFAVVLIGYFTIFTDFGLGTLLTREVARDRAQAERYLANSLGLRLVLCLASLPVIGAIVAIYATFFNLTPAGVLTIAFFTISLFPSAVSGAFSAVFFAFEKMEYPAIMTSISTLLKVILGMVALFSGWGIAGLGAVSVVVSVITAVMFWRLLVSTFFWPNWRFDPSFGREIAVVSFPLMINNFLSTVFFRIDVLFLKPIQGDTITGYYTTAYKFIDGLNVIPSLFTIAIFPIFARYAASSTEGLKLGFHRALKFLLIFSIPMTVATTFLADRVIGTFFGAAFAESADALRILVWFLPFSFINNVTHYVLIALNQQRFLTRAFIIGVVFNVIANILLIPRYGLVGASITTVLSEIVLLIPFFYAVRSELRWLPSLSLVARPAAAALAMGLALFVVKPYLPFIADYLFAAGVYLAVLLAIGGFDDDDLDLLKRIVRRGRAVAPAPAG